VTAIVVCKPGASATAAELIEHARGNLAAFKLPKQMFFIDALPKNTAGKLLKRELETRFAPKQ
jgi:fatty-acyl-CoA synthase